MRKLFRGIPLLLTAAACAQEYKLGAKVGDFTLNDLKGTPVAFSTLRGSTTVIVFVATRCPISNGYVERMNAVYRDYNPRGVKFVFVNSNTNEPAAEVAEHIRTHGLEFAVYKDPDNAVADRFGASVTPETFVLNADGAMVYHGYIDDSLNPARIQNHGLRKALDAVLGGQAVPAAETKAFGCTIKKRKRAS